MKQFLESLETRDRRADLALLALIFLLALVLRLGYIGLLWGAPEPPEEDPHYYSLIAQHLVEGRGFVEIASRAYRPPAYPWLLAAIYSVFGVNMNAARIVLAVFGALSCVLLSLWARQLSTRRVGYFAGLMAAVYPQFVRYPQTLYAEAFYMFLLYLGMAVLLWAVRSDRLAGAALAGASFGLATLTRETTLMMLAVVGIWLWMSRASLRRGRALKLWLVVSAATILTVLPWTVRNYFVLGAFIPISTNSGINFYIGNNPQFDGQPVWLLASGVEWEDGANEVEAHRRGLREGLLYAWQHPARTVGLWFKKAWLLWRPPYYGYGGQPLSVKAMRFMWLIFYLLNLSLGVYGFFRATRARRLMLLPLLVMACFSAPYVLTYADSRYRLPLEGCLIFYAMVGLELLLRSSRLRLAGPPVIQTEFTQTARRTLTEAA